MHAAVSFRFTGKVSAKSGKLDRHCHAAVLTKQQQQQQQQNGGSHSERRWTSFRPRISCCLRNDGRKHHCHARSREDGMQPKNDEHKHAKARDRRRFLKNGGKTAIWGAIALANSFADSASALGNGSGNGVGGGGGGENNENVPGGSGEWLLRRIEEGDDPRQRKGSRAIVVLDEGCLRIRILPAGWSAAAVVSVLLGGVWNLASLGFALSITDGVGIFGVLFATPFLGLGAIIIRGISYTVTAEARLEIGPNRYRSQEKQKYSPGEYHEGYTRDLKVKLVKPQVVGDNRVGTPREVKQELPYYLNLSDANGSMIPLAGLDGEAAKQIAEEIQAYLDLCAAK